VREDDRAVSEVVGFTLVFALILSMVALVTVAGFNDLEDVRSFEQSENAERAFDVVGDNIADVLLRGAPSRATELKLTDAQVYTGDPIVINVTANSSSTNNISKNVYSVRPIVYEPTGDANRETQIVYAGGTVFRVQRDGGRVVQEPPFVINDSRVVLPIAATFSSSTQSIGGSTIRLRVISTSRRLQAYGVNESYDNISINVTSPRSELWEEYLSDEPAVDNCDLKPAVNSVDCTIAESTDPPSEIPDRFIIQEVGIRIEFVN